MVRKTRIVIPDFPHHVTDRGNRGCHVFFSDDDRSRYLEMLLEYTNKRALEIGAYCLMDNHIHLVAVPRQLDSLSRAIGPVQMRHAQKINSKKGWKGHLWSDRFFSTPMDHSHFVAAVRYIELNPVRAEIVERAEDYQWSSASAHVSGISDPILSKAALFGLDDEVDDWSAWLAEGSNEKLVNRLKENTKSGYPSGSDSFIRFVSRSMGRDLKKRPRGRQPRSKP